jgi:hypothetical protein
MIFDYFDSEEHLKAIENQIKINEINRKKRKIRLYNRILLIIWSMFCLSAWVTGSMYIVEHWK